MILQTDNRRKFNAAAMTITKHCKYRGVCMTLTENDLIEIINEVKALCPECWMVRGSPCHSPLNGGVERVNRTIEEKLGAWMAETRSTNWSIGCRLMMWRYNTQNHWTINDVPYRLLSGQMPRVGISSLQLAPGLLDTLSTKAELNRVCNYVGNDPLLLESLAAAQASTQAAIKPIAVEHAEAMAIEAMAVEAAVETGIVGELGAVDEFDDNNIGNLPVIELFAGRRDDKEGDDEAVPDAGVVKDEEEISIWESHVRELPINVTVNADYLRNIRLWKKVPIAWCNNVKDVTNVASFVACFTTRIRKEDYKLTDANDLEMSRLEWSGDDGVENFCGCNYIQHPFKKYIEHFKKTPPMAALTSAMVIANEHAVSPKRAIICKLVVESLESKAKRMKDSAFEKMGGVSECFFIGEVVQVLISNFDRAKVDNQCLTGVIVELNQAKMKARIAVKARLFKLWYDYFKLSRVSSPWNNIKLLGLDDAFLNWKTMKVISEREGSANDSLVGRQGKGAVICSCRGACNSKSCKCFKAGRICSSACHRNNAKCENHDRHDNKFVGVEGIIHVLVK
jgi:hypothetical protein